VRAISFAWTTPALLAGQKTVTRRDWKDRYAASFRAGDLVAAYDRQARFGGNRVAMIRLLRAPYKESTADAPDSDYEAEGFTYLEGIGALVDGVTPRVLWRAWHVYPKYLWVVRFELAAVPWSEVTA
jgi:hypothetical protein